MSMFTNVVYVNVCINEHECIPHHGIMWTITDRLYVFCYFLLGESIKSSVSRTQGLETGDKSLRDP